MRLIGRVERFLEDVFEGTSRRLFRPAVQPIELARAAERAMEDGLVVGPAGPEAPNSYVVDLHPDDFARFASYRVTLQADLERHLADVARARGWRPAGFWQVQVRADAAVAPGRPRVVASLSDVTLRGDEGAPIIEETVPLRALGRDSGPARAHLESDDGRRFPLASASVSIGRALDNDVVLADSRVSRYHAQLRHEGGAWVLYDLESTNGSRVNGRPVRQAELPPDAEISLGGVTLRFRLEVSHSGAPA